MLSWVSIKCAFVPCTFGWGIGNSHGVRAVFIHRLHWRDLRRSRRKCVNLIAIKLRVRMKRIQLMPCFQLAQGGDRCRER